MVCMWYITPLLLATVVLADYDIDNANTSVIYSMAPSQSGLAWQIFSVGTQSLTLSFSNSTGNYTIPVDATHCYDENYALGLCGTNDNCFVQIPFTGSGITVYVFNAGLSGMTASFSVDSGAAVSKTIQAPSAPVYQEANVSLYTIQGLTTGNHMMIMTVLDWGASPTSMKFDYAHVNETFVAPPTTTSSTSSMTSTSLPTQTSVGNSSASNKINLGGVIGGTLGGVALLASVLIGLSYFRKRQATCQEEISPQSTFQVNPFTSEQLNTPTPPPAPYAPQMTFFAQYPEARPSVPPFKRSAILRDGLAAGNHPSSELIQSPQSIRSGVSSHGLQPPRRRPSSSTDTDPRVHSSASHSADAGPPFSDPQIASRYNLAAEQLEIIDRLRTDRVPAETIARVVEGFVSLHLPAGETSSGHGTRRGIFFGALPPPSYQTRDR